MVAAFDVVHGARVLTKVKTRSPASVRWTTRREAQDVERCSTHAVATDRRGIPWHSLGSATATPLEAHAAGHGSLHHWSVRACSAVSRFRSLALAAARPGHGFRAPGAGHYGANRRTDRPRRLEWPVWRGANVTTLDVKIPHRRLSAALRPSSRLGQRLDRDSARADLGGCRRTLFTNVKGDCTPVAASLFRRLSVGRCNFPDSIALIQT